MTMKTISTPLAAMLIALGLSACGNSNDDSADPSANGNSGDSAEMGASSNDSGMQDSANSATGGSSMNDPASGDSQMNDAGMASSQSQGQNQAARQNQPLSEDVPEAAVAVLHGPPGDDQIRATIRFTSEGQGLAYTTEAEGLEPGEHGYHIHLYGDCSANDFTSAGTHFNLQGSSKNPPEDIDRITGDLGNLDVGDDGTASHQGTLENGSLTGPKAIIGRGVIIHSEPNDPSQPPIGAAGSRQACGVIGIAEAQSGDSASNMNSGNDNAAAANSGSAMSNNDSAMGDSSAGMSNGQANGDNAGGTAMSGGDSQMGSASAEPSGSVTGQSDEEAGSN